MPERAGYRELIDRAYDRKRRRQEQRIDERGAVGQLPECDCSRKRGPATIAARARDKPAAAKFHGPRFGRGVDSSLALLRRAVKHAEPRARHRSPRCVSATTTRSVA